MSSCRHSEDRTHHTIPNPNALSSGHGAALGAIATEARLREVAAAGGLLSAGLWLPARAQASVTGPDAPKPVPGGTTLPTANGDVLFHFFLPGSNNDPSLITDFVGNVGLANVDGTGKGSDNVTYNFDVDIRFMQGLYFGVDGRPHQGTFGFF